MLVDTHLLESVAPDRYRFHDLLRVYAAERAAADLPAAERDAAVGRLLTWYMRTADAAATAVSPHRYNIPLDAAAGGCVRRSASPAPRRPSPGTTASAPTWSPPPGRPPQSGLHEMAWRLPAPLFSVFNRRGNWADLVADAPHRAGQRPAGRT